jgi:alkylation response protein AidB-like acyl-CoA dehydrogenase
MDLSLSDSQVLIRDSVRTFVQRHVPRAELVRQAGAGEAWDPAWQTLFAEAGWTGALVPASCGGLELDPLSAALIFEELGRGAVPSPLLASSAMSVGLLLGCAESEQRDAALTGVKVFVPFAGAATHFLVTVSDGLAIVPASAASVRLLGGFIQAAYEVTFSGVSVGPLLRPGAASLDHSLSVARVMAAAYQVGGMMEMLDMSVAHSNTRVQFGTPIGRFQRVQDHIIRLLNAMDAAKWAVYEAAWAIESGRNGVGRSYLACSTAGDSAIEAANAAHEVHAAIGSDPRFGLTLYTRISRSMYELLGSPEWQRRQMADALGW